MDLKKLVLRPLSEWAPLLIAVILCLASPQLLPSEAYGLARADSAIVFAGAVLGFVLGGYRGPLDHQWHARRCGVDQQKLNLIESKFQYKEGYFLTWITIIIVAYILFFTYATKTFALQMKPGDHSANGGWPVAWPIAVITGVNVGLLAALSVQYAAFIRTATLLKAALDWPQCPRETIDDLRLAVFKYDQLFEPPGNIFVTIGIMATFLGLAIGLVTLDLSNLIAPGDAGDLANIVDQSIQQQRAGVSSLKTFMGCMGLALGVSMLGVMMSVAAQWLRGHGPDLDTASLLARARPIPAAEGH